MLNIISHPLFQPTNFSSDLEIHKHIQKSNPFNPIIRSFSFFPKVKNLNLNAYVLMAALWLPLPNIRYYKIDLASVLSGRHTTDLHMMLLRRLCAAVLLMCSCIRHLVLWCYKWDQFFSSHLWRDMTMNEQNLYFYDIPHSSLSSALPLFIIIIKLWKS